MKTIDEFKNLYRDMSAEELHNDNQKWKKQIEFLQHEFFFFKSLLDANIYDPEGLNLFEKLHLFKQEIDNVTKEGLKIIDSLMSHGEHLKIYLECDDINFDYFFIEIHTKIAYDVVVFVEESNNMKMRLFEYIESVIMK